MIQFIVLLEVLTITTQWPETLFYHLCGYLACYICYVCHVYLGIRKYHHFTQTIAYCHHL